MMAHCTTVAHLPSDNFHIYIHNDFTPCDWTGLVKNMGILYTSRHYLYS